VVTRPSSPVVLRAAADIGQQLVTWRELLNLPAGLVAERSGISRGTLHRLEKGEPGVSMAAFLSVLRALGQLNLVIDATDPYNTDLGRARADTMLRNRGKK
jgi:transcriptional regulator with XRE-family HTH domain